MANISRRAAIKAISGAVLTTGLPLDGVTAQDATTTTLRGRPTTANIDLETTAQEELPAAYQGAVLEAFQEIEDALPTFSDQPATRAPKGPRTYLTCSWQRKISSLQTHRQSDCPVPRSRTSSLASKQRRQRLLLRRGIMAWTLADEVHPALQKLRTSSGRLSSM